MTPRRRELIQAVFPELEDNERLPEIKEVCRILDILPEVEQSWLIENIFCIVDMRRTADRMRARGEL